MYVYNPCDCASVDVLTARRSTTTQLDKNAQLATTKAAMTSTVSFFVKKTHTHKHAHTNARTHTQLTHAAPCSPQFQPTPPHPSPARPSPAPGKNTFVVTKEWISAIQ